MATFTEREYRQLRELLRYQRFSPRGRIGGARRAPQFIYPGGQGAPIRFAYTETPLPPGTIWTESSTNPDSPWAFKPGFGECYLYQMVREDGNGDYIIKATDKPPDIPPEPPSEDPTPVPTPTVTVYNWTQDFVGGEDRLLVIAKELTSQEWIVIAEACPPYEDIYLQTEDS